MIKNPLVSALVAVLYIVLVAVSVIYGGPFIESLPVVAQLPLVLAPVAMLSLLVFSASVMGYLFFAGPLYLIVSGHEQQGIKLFVETLLCFALSVLGLFLTTALLGHFLL